MLVTCNHSQSTHMDQCKKQIVQNLMRNCLAFFLSSTVWEEGSIQPSEPSNAIPRCPWKQAVNEHAKAVRLQFRY